MPCVVIMEKVGSPPPFRRYAQRFLGRVLPGRFPDILSRFGLRCGKCIAGYLCCQRLSDLLVVAAYSDHGSDSFHGRHILDEVFESSSANLEVNGYYAVRRFRAVADAFVIGRVWSSSG